MKSRQSVIHITMIVNRIAMHPFRQPDSHARRSPLFTNNETSKTTRAFDSRKALQTRTSIHSQVANMSNLHTPLGDLDANSQLSNPFDTTPDANHKPAPGFTQESQQHRGLHNKLLKQEK